ncbi:MAG: hypothetical protein KIT57_04860 [Blastocatellales bacterium]|nr:hypothetical protein [Blastocatellales bacterium]
MRDDDKRLRRMGRPLSQSQQFYISSAWARPTPWSTNTTLRATWTGQTYPSGRTTTTSYDARRDV